MTDGAAQSTAALDDVSFIGQALALAERARGLCSPNPMVGAVVVRDGELVGKGFHTRAGAAHAEVEALRKRGSGRAAPRST